MRFVRWAAGTTSFLTIRGAISRSKTGSLKKLSTLAGRPLVLVDQVTDLTIGYCPYDSRDVSVKNDGMPPFSLAELVANQFSCLRFVRW